MELTKQQYDRYVGYCPMGMEPPPIEELEAVPIIAFDNLITRDKRQWSPEILSQSIDDGMGIVGKPLTLDHEWEDVEEIQGIIVDAQLQKLEKVPPRILNTVEAKSNRNIVKKEGYQPVIVTAAIAKFNPLLSGFQFGIKNVSFGGLPSDISLWCPHDGLNFEDPECRYLPPSRWFEYDEEFLSRSGYTVADYAIIKGQISFVELSSVLVPNLPGAQVIDRAISKYYM